MDTKSGFPYAELEFNKSAKVVDAAGFDELLAEAAKGDEPADVLVFVHGWNNDMDEARGWYGELASKFREVLDAGKVPAVSDRRFLILGVLWPSKKWAERALIAGNAAGLSGSPEDEDVVARLEELKGAFDAGDADQRLEAAKALVSQLENDPDARDAFVDLIRGIIPAGAKADADDFADGLMTDPGREILDALEAPVEPEVDEDAGGAAGGVGDDPDEDDGGAAALFSLSGIKAAAERLLNLTTYYQMKERAGIIGATGLNPCLRKVRESRADTRLHLIGHSFGGRLVTAATMGDPAQPALGPDTVTLLEAAFSHYGFAKDYEPAKNGFFRAVVTAHMSRGPVLITHSKHDTAVGYAYPLASRLAGQVASFLGDANDRFGGIGRNGAQKTPEAVTGTLEAVGGAYDFAADKLYNLNADAIIADHSDIRRVEVAYAVLAGISGAPVP
jgi:hypothetical protein